MEKDCRTHWQLGMPCHLEPLTGEEMSSAHVPVHSHPDKANLAGVVFAAEHSRGVAPIPGYNTLAPLMRAVRDPALSLIAVSDVDPTGPVMVEVPLVLNNTTFTPSQMLSGWRIGFADRYVCGDHREPVEHSAALRRAFEVLRQAGAQLVPVDARRENYSLQFSLQRSNEIDELVTAHRLDALVSDEQSAAFHGACTNGYPSLCEPLEEGAKLWVYGARWARDALPTLLCAFRQMSACVSGHP
jgi:hypothetical protein